jgi:hypothetical protein
VSTYCICVLVICVRIKYASSCYLHRRSFYLLYWHKRTNTDAEAAAPAAAVSGGAEAPERPHLAVSSWLAVGGMSTDVLRRCGLPRTAARHVFHVRASVGGPRVWTGAAIVELDEEYSVS